MNIGTTFNLESLSNPQLHFLMKLADEAEKILCDRNNAMVDAKAEALTVQIVAQQQAVAIIKKSHEAADNAFRKKIIGNVLTHAEARLSDLFGDKDHLKYEYRRPGYIGPIG